VAATGWAWEILLRKWTPPLAILLACGLHLLPVPRLLQRLTAGMMLHESGHATAAWLCAMAAVPLLWVTHVADHRSLVIAATESVALLGLAWWAHARRRRTLRMATVGLLSLHLPLTWWASEHTARGWVTWAGDGMGMVLAALLVTSFALPTRQILAHQGIRWGLLAIGANAWADLALPWWTALRHREVIPYGRIEGVGDSDPERLVTTWRWLEHNLVHSYVATSLVTLAAMAVAWRWGVRDAENRQRAGEQSL
jgi:hypothetical protein